jgi:hypothetical protein
MFICRGTDRRGGRPAGTTFGRFSIALLPDGVGIVGRVSSQTSVDKQLMQIAQRRHGDSRLTQFHG